MVQHTKSEDRLRVRLHEVLSDTSHALGVDPGLVKDGVEAHLQRLLAEHITTLGDGFTLTRREYRTPIGPVDILCKDGAGMTVAVEIKRRGDIDGVEQLTRYLELMNRDPHLRPVTGVYAAQQIKPQARTLAEDRGIRSSSSTRHAQGHRQRGTACEPTAPQTQSGRRCRPGQDRHVVASMLTSARAQTWVTTSGREVVAHVVTKRGRQNA